LDESAPEGNSPESFEVCLLVYDSVQM
jgi:hypothetical protein